MAKKLEGLVADRPVLSLRPQAALKQRLEDAAGASGRSMAREAEVRLEASFEAASAPKLERYIQNRSGLSYLIGKVTPLELTNQLGDVLLSVVRHAEGRGWSEIQTREALAAASVVVMHYYFWQGGDASPVPDVSPIPPADTKTRDLPPALAGYVIAEEQLLFNAFLEDQPTLQNTVDRKIANVWSGDGKIIVEVSPTEKPEHPPQAPRNAARSFVTPEELSAFKPVAASWFGVLMEREAQRASADTK